MKKLLIFFAILSVCLVSCKKNIEVSYQEGAEYDAYAVEDKTGQIKNIKVSYPISTAESIFVFYTIYQNYIPLGYSSPASPNITLLDCKVDKKQVVYKVDNFIFLSDIALFYNVLVKTCNLYGYDEIHIIFNESELF